MNQVTRERYLPPSDLPLPSLQPVLSTPRLALRPFTPDDAAEVQRLAGDRDVAATTRLIPHPYPDGLAEAFIRSLPEQYEHGKGATFAIALTDGALIGAISLAFHWEDQHAEMGYWVGKPYWNRGFCTEAARRILEFGFGPLKLSRVFANYLANNPASGRVLAKLGMRQEGCLRQHRLKNGRFEDLVLCGILAAEFPLARK
ncbi:GCN5-related N-acetyltransferase [Pirellula staleyi DSM 6068]|uniref:GCN5-related N-acetyltransferase n=1 Tax=Pirellula staleyi (strain ATCC 27377 / DSM 6068 / ICPB 4128) TaxID=530564 RepID=D2R3V5_PIRSD|nr:GNAT family N-acetyltransferase [Pirellula staleyi]ADB18804.1 GCN5-related N-acetyltransferase [Pirellula staleyi DSM 6068]